METGHTSFFQSLLVLKNVKRPLTILFYIMVGLYVILSEIIILGISLDAIFSMVRHDGTVGRKVGLILDFLNLDNLSHSLKPIYIYTMLIMFIYSSLTIAKLIQQKVIFHLKSLYIHKSLTNIKKVEKVGDVKQLKKDIKKIDHLLRVIIFFVFCAFLLFTIAVFIPIIAVILICLGYIHIYFSRVLEKSQQSKKLVTIEKEYTSYLKKKNKSDKKKDILRSEFWEEHIRKDSCMTSTTILNILIRGVSMISVLFVLSLTVNEVLSLYPIVLILVVGRFHQYLEGFSSSFKKLFY